MKAIWYGDRRDRVKWGGLIYLAELNNIANILQVAFFREDTYPVLQSNGGNIPLPLTVWEQFSDLENIQRLARATDRIIKVIDFPFEPNTRHEYISKVIEELKKVNGSKIVFLDPDTGIAPSSLQSPRPEHVALEEIQMIWDSLEANDILVVYQHAARTQEWLNKSKARLSRVCGRTVVQQLTSNEIAKDVALLWCMKKA